MRAMRVLVLAVAIAACHSPSPSPQPPGGDDQPDAMLGSGIDAASTTADAAPGDDPTAGVEWFTWPEQQPMLADASWGMQLTDIARHLPSQYGWQYWDHDAITAGHETSHGIHAHLRNYEAPSPIGWN